MMLFRMVTLSALTTFTACVGEVVPRPPEEIVVDHDLSDVRIEELVHDVAADQTGATDNEYSSTGKIHQAAPLGFARSNRAIRIDSCLKLVRIAGANAGVRNWDRSATGGYRELFQPGGAFTVL